nr:YciI family protein [Micromonospora sp. DSM 115978]
MKQYLLAVHTVEGEPIPSDDEIQTMYAQVGKVNDELRAAGAWVFGGGLLPAESTTVVRTENGTTTMTDGPFVETKEQLGGFWVLRCADLDEALAWADKCSRACLGPVEVRPFQDEPEG